MPQQMKMHRAASKHLTWHNSWVALPWSQLYVVIKPSTWHYLHVCFHGVGLPRLWASGIQLVASESSWRNLVMKIQAWLLSLGCFIIFC